MAPVPALTTWDGTCLCGLPLMRSALRDEQRANSGGKVRMSLFDTFKYDSSLHSSTPLGPPTRDCPTGPARAAPTMQPTGGLGDLLGGSATTAAL
eukprot:CAMPEP_0196783512 /NCGR_PEP_ID=MMETSP1104-20130614/14002_1 /TAXON_ID=33652 /ORGANISM="Cafeteria sp., Strain Caron Lab Isolate" /LENGTH=94 /DNA_ID=CAMNT_0042153763 /DNA_START=32 /DNA_END=314 /DNA_ORIENTATION=-